MPQTLPPIKPSRAGRLYIAYKGVPLVIDYNTDEYMTEHGEWQEWREFAYAEEVYHEGGLISGILSEDVLKLLDEVITKEIFK